MHKREEMGSSSTKEAVGGGTTTAHDHSAAKMSSNEKTSHNTYDHDQLQKIIQAWKAKLDPVKARASEALEETRKQAQTIAGLEKSLREAREEIKKQGDRIASLEKALKDSNDASSSLLARLMAAEDVLESFKEAAKHEAEEVSKREVAKGNNAKARRECRRPGTQAKRLQRGDPCRLHCKCPNRVLFDPPNP